jgi:hypothetical protein
MEALGDEITRLMLDLIDRRKVINPRFKPYWGLAQASRLGQPMKKAPRARCWRRSSCPALAWLTSGHSCGGAPGGGAVLGEWVRAR